MYNYNNEVKDKACVKYYHLGYHISVSEYIEVRWDISISLKHVTIYIYKGRIPSAFGLTKFELFEVFIGKYIC